MKKRVGSFLIITLIVLLSHPVNAVQTGGVQYNMPIDYSFINETNLNKEAENLFQSYIKAENSKQKEILLNKMLSDYSILSEINKENPLYVTRLGIIYDKLGKDRWAKSNFCKSTNLVPNYPYAFYSYGNFFFDRAEYRKALREYMRAYNTGYSSHYYNLYQIGVIHEKYGDFSEAIKFYKRALVYKDTPELRGKIQKLEELLTANSLYNQRQKVNKKWKK